MMNKTIGFIFTFLAIGVAGYAIIEYFFIDNPKSNRINIKHKF